MNAEDFIDVVHSGAQEVATRSVISVLEDPPGRRPDPKLVVLSRWFNTLSEDDKQRVREVAAMASHDAVFGILAMLDGVRAIEDGADRGALELRYVKGKESILLNDPEGPMLHDLLQSL